MKKYFQNVAIFLLVLIGIKNLLATLPLRFTQRMEHFYGTVIHPEEAAVHQMLTFFLGLLMLLVAYRLYKKVRLAWIMEVSLLFITIVMQVIRFHRFTVPIIIVEFFVLVVLLVTYKDFGRKPRRLTVKKSLSFIAVSLAILLISGTAGIFVMKGHLTNVHDIYDAFSGAIKLFIFMDKSVLTTTSVFSRIYVETLIDINWICIFAAVFLLLKPMIYNPIITKRHRDKVRKLVLDHGQNPMSYLALERDKQYFFGTKVDGVCAYTIISDVFVVCGDMICDQQDGPAFLSEIKDYCGKNMYQILFINITGTFTQDYQAGGFNMVKLGEDCCFKLSEYNLVGGKVAKVRAAINHATKAGINVYEYKPLVKKDEKIESDIADITEEWLRTKGGYELHFTVGGTGLWDPLDRRYFYSTDESGRMLGFVVFLPYQNGYLADVTRRRNNASQGVLEKIIYEAFMQFKEEGTEWGNMGLSSLYNISESDKANFTEKLFTYIYDNMNDGFGFKQLHHAKEKYAPTHWVPRYLAFYPKIFTPKLAIALVRCQFKTGIAKMIFSEVFKKNEK